MTKVYEEIENRNSRSKNWQQVKKMSSYPWNKSSLNQNPNDSKVAQHANLRENVSDVSDSSAGSNSKKVAKTENNAGRKRRKIKKTKEEKEDGELDEDNEDVNSQENEDDYEYYDSDESNKNNKTSLAKTSIESAKKEPELKVPTPPAATPTAATVPLTLQTVPEATFSITNPYDSEYEDYDSDDDDYGNNKRLKIDESEDLPEEKPNADLTKASDDKIEVAKSNEALLNKKETCQETKSIKVDKIKTISDETKFIEIENDNSTSSAASTKSNSSSYELNAISNNYSESAAANKSPSNDQGTNKKDLKSAKAPETLNQEKDGQTNKSESNNGSSKSPSSESDANSETKTSDTNETVSKIPNDSKQKKAVAVDEKLKVPSLKIIFSNSNGGHPYVKAPPNNGAATEKAPKNGKSASSKKEEATFNGEVSSAATTPTKSTEAQNLNIQDSPANNSRSKSSRSSRVSSPITTSYKSTPTRRSAAAVAAAALSSAGRSSPSSASSRAQAAAAEIAASSSSSSSSSMSSTSNQPGDPDTPGPRRKLRSHTRLGVDELPAIGRVQNSSTTKSPSPLTVHSESSGNEIDQTTTATEAKTAQATTEASELLNSSVIDSDTALPTLNAPLPPLSTTLPPISTTLTLSDFLPTRKKRNRQQQQELQEQLDLINEIEGLNALAASAMHSHDSFLADGTCPFGCAKSLNESNDERYQPSLFNCIRKFVDLRNDVTKRREMLMQTKIDVKLPKNFNEFILNRKSYLIRTNKEARKSIPFFKPPNDIPEALKDFFFKQEKERYSLRVRQRVEQDKLTILYEQEILRCFNKSAREAVKQTIPFSFCSMIKDDEIYSQFRISEQASLSATTAPSMINLDSNNSNEQASVNKVGQEEQSKQIEENSSQSKPSTETGSEIKSDEAFSKKIEELKVKFQNLKDELIKRQINESDSLHGVQKMNFQSKLRELSNKYKNAATNTTNPTQTSPTTNANIAAASLTAYNIISQFQQNDQHVPIVHVNNKFNLLDAPQEQFISNNSPSNGTSVSIYA